MLAAVENRKQSAEELQVSAGQKRPLVPRSRLTQTAPEAVRELYTYFSSLYGNKIRAWRFAFDPDSRGKINQVQFYQAIRMHTGCNPNPRKCWEALTNQSFGDYPLYLEQFAPEEMKMLRSFRSLILKKYGECAGTDLQCEEVLWRIWKDVDVDKDGSLGAYEIASLAREVKYPLNHSTVLYHFLLPWVAARQSHAQQLSGDDLRWLIKFVPRGVAPENPPVVDPPGARHQIDPEHRAEQTADLYQRYSSGEILIQQRIQERREAAIRREFRPPFTESELEEMARHVLKDTASALTETHLGGAARSRTGVAKLQKMLATYEQNVADLETLEKNIPDKTWCDKLQILTGAYYQCMRDIVASL